MSENSLSGVVGTWIGDGSGGNLSVALPELSISSATKGSPFNVMLSADLPSNNFYFEVEVKTLAGNVSVGVVKKEEFLPGYKVKGMFYNGNVTNGCAGLIIGFGEYVKVGSRVGVAVSHKAGTLKTVFFLNGRSLGTAFCIAGVSLSDTFRPCIHVTGETTVAYSVPTVPTTIERQNEHQSDPYLGHWKLDKLLAGPELNEFPLPSNYDIVLTLQEGSDDKTYDFSVKVANTYSTSIKVTGKADGLDAIKIGVARATMMMPPPELQAVEGLIAQSLPRLYKMIVADHLVMTGATEEFIASRYYKQYTPLEKY